MRLPYNRVRALNCQQHISGKNLPKYPLLPGLLNTPLSHFSWRNKWNSRNSYHNCFFSYTETCKIMLRPNWEDANVSIGKSKSSHVQTSPCTLLLLLDAGLCYSLLSTSVKTTNLSNKISKLSWQPILLSVRLPMGASHDHNTPFSFTGCLKTTNICN